MSLFSSSKIKAASARRYYRERRVSDNVYRLVIDAINKAASRGS